LDYSSDLEFETHKYFQNQERKEEISSLIISTSKTDLGLVSQSRNPVLLNSRALPSHNYDVSVSKGQ